MSTTKEMKFISIDNLNLPNHGNDLIDIEGYIEKLKTKTLEILEKNSIDDITHQEIFDRTITILKHLGELSDPVFEILEPLNVMYALEFKHSPALAKKLWLKHYDDLHRPYTILKNRCHKIIENIDQGYLNKFKSNPPNWEI